jgi:hypothetical protein
MAGQFQESDEAKWKVFDRFNDGGFVSAVDHGNQRRSTVATATRLA